MQSNNQSAETPKLKLVAIITHREVIDKEISIPYFFQDEYGNKCKLVSKDFFLSAKADKNFIYGVQAYAVNDFKERIAKGTPITADEYEAAYSQAMMYVDLINRNEEPVKEEDPNVTIDRMIENKIAS